MNRISLIKNIIIYMTDSSVDNNAKDMILYFYDLLPSHSTSFVHLSAATDNHFAKKRELALLVQKRRLEADLKNRTLKGRNEVQ